MIIVDTSVWINFFNGKNSEQVNLLDNALGTEAVAIGDLIALEILQGFKKDKDYNTAKGLINSLTIYDMLGQNTVLSCADNYRKLRKKGITVRKTADVIIASFCISHDFPLLFLDKDFQPFVKHMGLKEVKSM